MLTQKVNFKRMVITENDLSVREAEENDFENIVDYFLKADNHFLQGMGVDPNKLPKEKNG